MLSVRARGKLSGIAKDDSEFFGVDEEDLRPRARFFITNEFGPIKQRIEINALVDSGAECGLILPMSVAELLNLRRSGTGSSKGSTNATAKKVFFWPVNLEATFVRDGVDEIRSAFIPVSAFEEPSEKVLAGPDATDCQSITGIGSGLKSMPLSAESRNCGDKESRTSTEGAGGGSGQKETPSPSSKRVRQNSESSPEGRVVISRVPLIEHRPPSAPNQRVILGAKALKELSIHVNVAGRCLEIEEERTFEYDE